MPKKSFPNREKEEVFFNELAIESNLSDLQSSKNVYYALLRVILSNLKKSERIYLPQWGEFRLQIRKAGRVIHKDTGQIVSYGETKCVKFKPFHKLKYFFRETRK